MPGVRDIVNRVRSQGDIAPNQLVESCLDLMGPVQATDETRGQLLDLAEQCGTMHWGTEEESSSSARRVADMLSVIAASREYQFG